METAKLPPVIVYKMMISNLPSSSNTFHEMLIIWLLSNKNAMDDLFQNSLSDFRKHYIKFHFFYYHSWDSGWMASCLLQVIEKLVEKGLITSIIFEFTNLKISFCVLDQGTLPISETHLNTRPDHLHFRVRGYRKLQFDDGHLDCEKEPDHLSQSKLFLSIAFSF